jgi:hypothetical protein
MIAEKAGKHCSDCLAGWAVDRIQLQSAKTEAALPCKATIMESLEARMARTVQCSKFLISGMVAALWSVLGLNGD